MTIIVGLFLSFVFSGNFWLLLEQSRGQSPQAFWPVGERT